MPRAMDSKNPYNLPSKVSFYNVRRRRKVNIPNADVEVIKKKHVLMLKTKDPEDGTKMTTFAKKPQSV